MGSCPRMLGGMLMLFAAVLRPEGVAAQVVPGGSGLAGTAARPAPTTAPVSQPAGTDKLYFVSAGNLCRANRDGSDLETLVPRVGFLVAAPVVDASRVYWPASSLSRGPGERSSRGILCADLDGSDPHMLLETEDTVSVLTVDPKANRLYYVVRTELREMLLGQPDTRPKPALLLDIREFEPTCIRLQGLAIDPGDNILFWISRNDGASVVRRIDLETRKARTIATSEGDWLSGLQYDPVRKHLFWASRPDYRLARPVGRGQSTLYRATRDGKDVRKLPASVEPFMTLLPIDPVAGDLYLQGRAAIYRGDHDGKAFTLVMQAPQQPAMPMPGGWPGPLPPRPTGSRLSPDT